MRSDFLVWCQEATRHLYVRDGDQLESSKKLTAEHEHKGSKMVSNVFQFGIDSKKVSFLNISFNFLHMKIADIRTSVTNAVAFITPFLRTLGPKFPCNWDLMDAAYKTNQAGYDLYAVLARFAKKQDVMPIHDEFHPWPSFPENSENARIVLAN